MKNLCMLILLAFFLNYFSPTVQADTVKTVVVKTHKRHPRHHRHWHHHHHHHHRKVIIIKHG
jgi:hypothetical protein